jgi:hypothetical protein
MKVNKTLNIEHSLSNVTFQLLMKSMTGPCHNRANFCTAQTLGVITDLANTRCNFSGRMVFFFLLLFFFFFFFFSSSRAHQHKCPGTHRSLRLIVPKAEWLPLLFVWMNNIS